MGKAQARFQVVNNLVDWHDRYDESYFLPHLQGLIDKYTGAYRDQRNAYEISPTGLAIAEARAQVMADLIVWWNREDRDTFFWHLGELHERYREAYRAEREQEREVERERARQEAAAAEAEAARRRRLAAEVDELTMRMERTGFAFEVQSDTESDDTDVKVPKSNWERCDLIEQTVGDILSLLPDPDYADKREKKLLIWQSLCLELGLAKIGEDTERPDAWEYTDFITRRNFANRRPPYRLFSTDYDLPDVPLSLTACGRLLHSRGHVNILEYCAARRDRMDLIEAHRARVGKRTTRAMLCSLNNQGAFANLVQSSADSMAWDAQLKRRVVKRNVVKDNWFDPLMRHF